MTTPKDAQSPSSADAERITLEEIKQRAQNVRDLTVSESKDAVRRVMALDTTRKMLISAGVVLAVVSVAYLMGSRACRRSLGED